MKTARELIQDSINGLEWQIENEPMSVSKSDYEHLDNLKNFLSQQSNTPTNNVTDEERIEQILSDFWRASNGRHPNKESAINKYKKQITDLFITLK